MLTSNQFNYSEFDYDRQMKNRAKKLKKHPWRKKNLIQEDEIILTGTELEEALDEVTSKWGDF